MGGPLPTCIMPGDVGSGDSGLGEEGGESLREGGAPSECTLQPLRGLSLLQLCLPPLSTSTSAPSSRSDLSPSEGPLCAGGCLVGRMPSQMLRLFQSLLSF